MELSLWLADFEGGDVVARSLSATIGPVRKSELELFFVGWLQLNDSDEIVIVTKLLECRKVSVLMLLDWRVRIRVSEAEFVGILILQHLSEDSFGKLAHHGRPFLS